MKYILKIGHMFISRVSIDSYDTDIYVDFTSNREDACVFDYEISELYISLLVNLFNCEIIRVDHVHSNVQP